MIVKIYQAQKTAMQSGRNKTGKWVLESDPNKPSIPTNLMGWSGGGDSLRQVHLLFDTKDNAIAYARKQGWAYHLLGGRERRIKPKAYGDNFAYNRLKPWTH